MGSLLSWLIWATASAAIALIVRNPLYLTLIGLAAWAAFAAAGQRAGSMARSWQTLLRLGAFVWLLTIPFNAVMIHQGRHILFRLPAHWPLVGGPITLEAILHGAALGLSLWVLLIIFVALNAAVDVSQLLRLTPAFLYQAGVVTSVALTFVPQMLVSAREIREAQQIRGHRFRSWRDMLPLLAPLLTTALERAIQLAESMESRGFGGQLTRLTPRQTRSLRLRMLAALGALLCGLFVYAYWPRTPWPGLVLIAVSGVALLTLMRNLGKHVERSTYRRARWQDGDTLVSAMGVFTLALVLVVRLSDGAALLYYPFPPFSLWPTFDPWIGLALTLLAAPALVTLFAGEMQPFVSASSAQPSLKQETP